MGSKGPCRFCGGDDLKVWTGKYYRCNDCLFISSMPPPTPTELDDHYQNYHEANHQAVQEKNEQRSKSYEQEIGWLEEKLALEGIRTVYDYGASGGYFLDTLRGFLPEQTELSGTDASPGARKLLASKGYLRDLDKIARDSIKLVTLRGVLEHLLDFRHVVAELCSRLETGGFLFITATPDSSSTVAEGYRECWIQHHYPSHFQHFNSRLVDVLMGENGLVPLATTELYDRSVYRGSEDDVLWLRHCREGAAGSGHAYWGSMMTRIYKKLDLP